MTHNLPPVCMHFYYHIILTEQIQEFISIAFLLIFDTIIVIGETLNITLRIGEIICQKLLKTKTK